MSRDITRTANRARAGEATIARLLTTAKLLYANAIGCAVNHHNEDFVRFHGKPGWLSDCEKDILAAEKAADMLAALRAALTAVEQERDEAHADAVTEGSLKEKAIYEMCQLRSDLTAAREALAQEREALEMAEALLSRPLTRDLETGFRHSPLTNAERDKRYAETCKFALEHVQAAIRARSEPTS